MVFKTHLDFTHSFVCYLGPLWFGHGDAAGGPAGILFVFSQNSGERGCTVTPKNSFANWERIFVYCV